MKKRCRIIYFSSLLLAACLFYPAETLGQFNDTIVMYTPDFRFREGIFLNFDQVKSNSPVPKAKLLTSSDYNDKDFFRKILELDRIYYYDVMGIRKEVDKRSIWGYCRNGVLYIKIQDDFTRVTFVGSICHFVADITTFEQRYYNPYGGYYDSYYNPYSYYPGYGGYYYPYGSFYSPYSRSGQSRSEVKQFIFDFETGKVLDFDIRNTELLLMKDAAIYEEYMQLPRKKKQALMFVYIRKFNEKNPLYIPVTY
jgi:hypothetical protein